MAVHEWIVAVYFAAVVLAAWVRPIGSGPRLVASAIGVGVLAAVFGVVWLASPTLRACAPLVYLIAGYWAPAMLVVPSADRRFEDWLVHADERFRRVLPPVPAPLNGAVELAYLLCYPLVPIAFSIVWWNGSETDIARFWLGVLLAGYSCYVTLPWLVSRPPRLRSGHRKRHSLLPRINARVLERVSHRLNTFPSGHVAVAAAAAAGVSTVSPAGGAALSAVVLAIGVGAAAGGYHYAIDVILGLVVAVAAVTVAGTL